MTSRSSGPWLVRILQTPAVAAIVIALVAVAVGLVRTASAPQERIAATNRIPLPEFTRTLGAARQFCQPVDVVPADTGAVRMLIGTYGRPGPPLDVTVRAGGQTVTSGGLNGGWAQGVVSAPLEVPGRSAERARVCVRNQGSSRIALGGWRGQVRFDFLSDHKRSIAGSFGWLAQRFDEGKSSWYGPWALWLAAALVLSGAGLGVVALVRGVGR